MKKKYYVVEEHVRVCYEEDLFINEENALEEIYNKLNHLTENERKNSFFRCYEVEMTDYEVELYGDVGIDTNQFWTRDIIQILDGVIL